METETIIMIAAIAMIAFFLLISYVKAPPSYAFIITGLFVAGSVNMFLLDCFNCSVSF